MRYFALQIDHKSMGTSWHYKLRIGRSLYDGSPSEDPPLYRRLINMRIVVRDICVRKGPEIHPMQTSVVNHPPNSLLILYCVRISPLTICGIEREREAEKVRNK